ncbi:hypothetical protein [Pseudomonas sp. NPDC089734]|uniref:PA0061/PA0062 family lipoprotein n=1 Tax=Pseudomonas sp. NPDC089734 TaxID=3364469 RepID=UPI0038186A0A
MKKLLIVCSLLIISACSTVLPAPDKTSSLVEMSANNKNTLLAQKVDGSTVRDGRYFQLSPGAHELEVLIVSQSFEGSTVSRFASFKFDHFLPESRYNLKLVGGSHNLHLQLRDETGELIKEVSL